MTPTGCLRKKKKKSLKGEEKAVTVLLVSETKRAFFPLPDCAQSRLFLYKEWQLWLYLWKHSYFQSTLLCLGSVQLPTEQEQFSYSGKTASTLWCDSEVVTVLWIHNLFECVLAFKCKEAPKHVKSQEKKSRENWPRVIVLILLFLVGIILVQKIQGMHLIRSLFSGKIFLEPFECCVWKLWSCLMHSCWAW